MRGVQIDLMLTCADSGHQGTEILRTLFIYLMDPIFNTQCISPYKAEEEMGFHMGTASLIHVRNELKNQY